jgi:hypothetical protein
MRQIHLAPEFQAFSDGQHPHLQPLGNLPHRGPRMIDDFEGDSVPDRRSLVW